jgi:hypothetical protein
LTDGQIIITIGNCTDVRHRHCGRRTIFKATQSVEGLQRSIGTGAKSETSDSIESEEIVVDGLERVSLSGGIR